MLINLYRKNTPNIGDVCSTPCKYFPELAEVKPIDIFGYHLSEAGSEEAVKEWYDAVSNADGAIIGGGGLLASEWCSHRLANFFPQRKKDTPVVVWGAGHNTNHPKSWSAMMKPDLGISIDPPSLIGIRDFGYSYDWVPCASCMNPLFDSPKEATHDVVLYCHGDMVDKELYPEGIPIASNYASMESAIDFLSSGDLILTDSFHGAYWATLLGKRVVAFGTSSKFYGLKHPVPLCHISDWRRYQRLASRYPDALTECRAANVAFSKKVFELLKL